MSITELSDPNKMYKKLCHWRNDSGELDVFEAARYFSGGGADEVLGCGATLAQKQILKEKKNKQPSSPGGRLAQFLNSLFNQTSLKKKKSKSTKDEEESPGGRRKRRSSISHFRTANSTTTDSKSFYSSSSSGFRTPPPHANTPTKSYKDFRNFSDYNKQIISVQKFNGNVKSDYSSSWLDEKFKFSNGYSDKNWNDKYPLEENEFRKFSDVDDGADSDSSSDLFDLPNHELDFYSSDLPVYETTHLDSIKRTAPISSTGKV
ncbi:hypothetical protein Adt_15503 [Abeliophyllum distichum]|uniref:Uncharacterized protein n=1 Tax=Abeliophyllum distichum TaxID=126358 RepID=A0ABD1U2M9_9LAMI